MHTIHIPVVYMVDALTDKAEPVNQTIELNEAAIQSTCKWTVTCSDGCRLIDDFGNEYFTTLSHDEVEKRLNEVKGT